MSPEQRPSQKFRASSSHCDVVLHDASSTVRSAPSKQCTTIPVYCPVTTHDPPCAEKEETPQRFASLDEELDDDDDDVELRLLLPFDPLDADEEEEEVVFELELELLEVNVSPAQTETPQCVLQYCSPSVVQLCASLQVRLLSVVTVQSLHVHSASVNVVPPRSHEAPTSDVFLRQVVLSEEPPVPPVVPPVEPPVVSPPVLLSGQVISPQSRTHVPRVMR